jgi:hypothetical protein
MQFLVDSLFREQQQRLVIYQVGAHYQTVETTPDKIGHAPNRHPGERGAPFRRMVRCGSSPC